MSTEDGRTRAGEPPEETTGGEDRGTSPGTLAGLGLLGDPRSRVVGIVLAAGLGLAVIAAVAFLSLRGNGVGQEGGVLGLGGGPPNLAGRWDVAITPEAGGETGVGDVSLTHDDEGGLSVTGEVAFPDESLALSMRGAVEEQKKGPRTVTLASADGEYQLRGMLSEDSRSMEGSATWTGADEAGSFSAVRSSGAAAAPGTDERRQVREAVLEYVEARSYGGGVGGREHLDRIARTVVAPAYWESTAGKVSRENAEEVDRGPGRISSEYRMVDFVPSGASDREVTGTIRYAQDYREGGASSTTDWAAEARVVRWGSGWRVLGAGGGVRDPWGALPGTWQVTTEDANEYFADPEYSELAEGAADGFEMRISSVEADGSGSYEVAGTADGVFAGGADLIGDVYAGEGGGLTARLVLEDADEPTFAHELVLEDVVVPGDGTMRASAQDTTAAVMGGPPEADVTATRDSDE